MSEMDSSAKIDPATTTLLQQLKDIEIPDPAPWWPPAPGWWILASGLLLALFLIFRFLRKRQRRGRYRKDALSILAELHGRWQANRDAGAYARAAHQLVRRAAIELAGRDAVSRRTGDAFLDVIHTLSTGSLSRESGRLLTEQSYRPRIDEDVDIEEVNREIETWLRGLGESRRA